MDLEQTKTSRVHSDLWRYGDLEADFDAHIVKKGNDSIRLTPAEFRLFAALAKRPRKVFTREDLIEIAYGNDFLGSDRTIDSHIKNLRAKIETDTAAPQYIVTIWGVGYRFGR